MSGKSNQWMNGDIYPLGHTGFSYKRTYMETYEPFGLLSKSSRQDVVVSAFCGRLSTLLSSSVAASHTWENTRGKSHHRQRWGIWRSYSWHASTDLWGERWVTAVPSWLAFLGRTGGQHLRPAGNGPVAALTLTSPGVWMGPGSRGWDLLAGGGLGWWSAVGKVKFGIIPHLWFLQNSSVSLAAAPRWAFSGCRVGKISYLCFRWPTRN